MASYDFGKTEVCDWIRKKFPNDAEILDVGACDGKWRALLADYPNMDAVEVWPPNAEEIKPLYREVFCSDIADLKYKDYDLIIFGDVIEHMEVSTAQKVLKKAKNKCKDMIVAVPFLYRQGALYGNPYEEHKQADLTAEIFDNRYPGFDSLVDTGKNYVFYHMKGR